MLLGFGCQPGSSPGSDGRPVVEVTATDSSLDTDGPVPSGWITFRMENEGERHHSFRLRELPEGRTFEDFHEEVLRPVDSLEKAVVEGRIDSATYRKGLRQALPEWFPGETALVGGITGLAPGRTAQITHNLDPGHYALLCFFQTPGERPHFARGVRAGLQVSEDSSGAPAPTADLTARLSPGSFEVDTTALSGNQTIAFRSTGNAKGESSQGESSPWAGLFRLTSETGPEDITNWMQKGLPLSVPTEWLGGPEPMPPGDVAYVRVGDLSPGRYAWITVAAPDTSGMVKTFTVGAE